MLLKISCVCVCFLSTSYFNSKKLRALSKLRTTQNPSGCKNFRIYNLLSIAKSATRVVGQTQSEVWRGLTFVPLHGCSWICFHLSSYIVHRPLMQLAISAIEEQMDFSFTQKRQCGACPNAAVPRAELGKTTATSENVAHGVSTLHI